MRPEWAAALHGAAPAPAGRRSQELRLASVVAAALLVAALVGGLAVAVVNRVVLTPEVAAQKYLAALAAGDVAEVLDTLIPRPDAQQQPLLSEAVTRSGDFRGIRDASVGAVTGSGERVAVSVSYRLGDAQKNEQVVLVQGPARAGLFRTWKVSAQLPLLTTGSQQIAASVGGQRLKDRSMLLALPGTYTVHAVDHPALTAHDTTVNAYMTGRSLVQLAAEIKPGTLNSAEEAVWARVQACAQSTQLPLQNCPFLTESSWSQVQNPQLQLVQQPTFSLSYDSSSGGLNIMSRSYGSVRVTGTQSRSLFGTPSASTAYNQQQTFSVSGTVSLNSGRPEVRFR